MGDYWRDVSPMLMRQARDKRAREFDKRLAYAIKRFDEEMIPYKICNAANGHINLYKDLKVIMSFWTYTGMINIIGEPSVDSRGIENCIKIYKRR